MSVVRQGMLVQGNPARANPLAMAVRFAGMGVLILVLLTVCRPSLLFTVQTWQLIAYETVPTGLLAIGFALVMTTGTIDLSLAANFSLCAAVAGWLMANGHSAGLAIVTGIVVGVVCAAINGMLVGVLGLPAVTATLGSLALLSGLALAIGNGEVMVVDFFPSVFTNGFGVVLAILMLLLGIALWIALAITPIGARIADQNAQAGTSGPQDTLVRPELIPLYGCAGLLAALAAMVELGRLQSTDPSIGNSSLITAIAAAAVGGVGLFRGGPLAIPGAALGALLVSVVATELQIGNATFGWVEFALGAIIAVSLLVDRMLEFIVIS